MAVITQKFETDIVPRIGINNDFMRIYNRMNNTMGNIVIINNLLNLLEMRAGINKEFPSIGLAQEFLKLSFVNMSQIDGMLDNIAASIKNQVGYEVDLSYEINNPESPQSYITIKLSIDNIPGSIDIDLVNTRYNSKAIETKYSK